MTASPERDAAAQRTLQVVQDFYSHLGKGDVPAVLALFDPQIKWTEAEGFPYFSGTWTGPEAVLNNLFKRLGNDWSDFTAKASDHLVEGMKVVSFGGYSGTYKKTRKSMRANFAHVWRVSSGRLASFQMHADTAKMREAMGL